MISPVFKTLRPFGVLFLLDATGAGAGAADLQTLVNHSPFTPPATLAETKPEAPETLEFRGLVVDERGTTYSLFDVAAKRSYWVREGGRGAIRVKAFDAEECVLEVEQNGKALTLPLKSATIATSAAVAATPVAAAPGAGMPGDRGGRRPVRTTRLPAVAAGDNRLQKIAEQVRQRRAARLTAAGGNKTPAPGPAATPGF